MWIVWVHSSFLSWLVLVVFMSNINIITTAVLYKISFMSVLAVSNRLHRFCVWPLLGNNDLFMYPTYNNAAAHQNNLILICFSFLLLRIPRHFYCYLFSSLWFTHLKLPGFICGCTVIKQWMWMTINLITCCKAKKLKRRQKEYWVNFLFTTQEGEIRGTSQSPGCHRNSFLQ